MATSSITTTVGALPGIPIGPCLRAELERRVRELEGRFKPGLRDMRELAQLAQLKEFLKITPITERDGQAWQTSDRP
jgi:hypothetical protein